MIAVFCPFALIAVLMMAYYSVMNYVEQKDQTKVHAASCGRGNHSISTGNTRATPRHRLLLESMIKHGMEESKLNVVHEDDFHALPSLSAAFTPSASAGYWSNRQLALGHHMYTREAGGETGGVRGEKEVVDTIRQDNKREGRKQRVRAEGGERREGGEGREHRDKKDHRLLQVAKKMKQRKKQLPLVVYESQRMPIGSHPFPTIRPQSPSYWLDRKDALGYSVRLTKVTTPTESDAFRSRNAGYRREVGFMELPTPLR